MSLTSLLDLGCKILNSHSLVCLLEFFFVGNCHLFGLAVLTSIKCNYVYIDMYPSKIFMYHVRWLMMVLYYGSFDYDIYES